MMTFRGVSSYSVTQGRVAPRGPLFHAISMSTLSFQRKSSPHPCIYLTGPPQAGLKSGFGANDRQLEVLHKFRMRRRGLVFKRGMAQGVSVRALQGGGRAPRRLVDVIRAVPRVSRAYFKSPLRRALYGGISLLGGFYVAQTISLSFGALGINDVIAAALCLLFAEYVTKFYHTRARMTFSVAILNNFKMGFTYGLFIDAFKLAS